MTTFAGFYLKVTEGTRGFYWVAYDETEIVTSFQQNDQVFTTPAAAEIEACRTLAARAEKFTAETQFSVTVHAYEEGCSEIFCGPYEKAVEVMTKKGQSLYSAGWNSGNPTFGGKYRSKFGVNWIHNPIYTSDNDPILPYTIVEIAPIIDEAIEGHDPEIEGCLYPAGELTEYSGDWFIDPDDGCKWYLVNQCTGLQFETREIPIYANRGNHAESMIVDHQTHAIKWAATQIPDQWYAAAHSRKREN